MIQRLLVVLLVLLPGLARSDTPLLGLQYGSQEYENRNWTILDSCLGQMTTCDGTMLGGGTGSFTSLNVDGTLTADVLYGDTFLAPLGCADDQVPFFNTVGPLTLMSCETGFGYNPSTNAFTVPGPITAGGVTGDLTASDDLIVGDDATINGTLIIPTGANAGDCLFSDASGNASWGACSAGFGGLDVRTFGAVCDGVTDDSAAMTAALAAAAAAGGRTIELSARCRMRITSPGAGLTKFTVPTGTTIACADPTAGFVLDRRVCVGGTYPGAACSVAGDCLGGGTCPGAAPFAPTLGVSYGLFVAAAGADAPGMKRCTFDVAGRDDYLTCVGGANAGRACEQYCSAGLEQGAVCELAACAGVGVCTAFAGGGLCIGGADNLKTCCPTSTCINAGSCGAGSLCSGQSGSPVGAGDVNLVDFTPATNATLDDLVATDHRQGLFTFKVGNGGRINHVDNTQTKISLTVPTGGVLGYPKFGTQPQYQIATALTAGAGSVVEDSTVIAGNTIVADSVIAPTTIGVTITGGAASVRNNTIQATGIGVTTSGGSGTEVQHNTITGLTRVDSIGISSTSGGATIADNTLIGQPSLYCTSGDRVDKACGINSTDVTSGCGAGATCAYNPPTSIGCCVPSTSIGIQAIAGTNVVDHNTLKDPSGLAGRVPATGIILNGAFNVAENNEVGVGGHISRYGIYVEGDGITIDRVLGNSISAAPIWPATPTAIYVSGQQHLAADNFVTGSWYCYRNQIVDANLSCTGVDAPLPCCDGPGAGNCGDGLNTQFTNNRCFGGGVVVTGAGTDVIGNYLAWNGGERGHCNGVGTNAYGNCRMSSGTDCAGGGTCIREPIIDLGHDGLFGIGTSHSRIALNLLHSFPVTSTCIEAAPMAQRCQNGERKGKVCTTNDTNATTGCGASAVCVVNPGINLYGCCQTSHVAANPITENQFLACDIGIDFSKVTNTAIYAMTVTGNTFDPVAVATGIKFPTTVARYCDNSSTANRGGVCTTDADCGAVAGSCDQVVQTVSLQANNLDGVVTPIENWNPLFGRVWEPTVATLGSQMAGSFMGIPPATLTIVDTVTVVTADACGGIKRITAAGAVSTNTTDTFTAPALANAGCVMDVCNVGANAITLDENPLFVVKAGVANAVLGATDCVRVGSDGAIWRQLTEIFDGG